MSQQLTSVRSDLPLACRRVSPDTVLGSSFCLQEVKRTVRPPAPTCTSCQVRSRRRPASIPAEIGLGAKRPISPIAPPWSSGRCEQLPCRIGCRLEVGGETTGGRPPPTHPPSLVWVQSKATEICDQTSECSPSRVSQSSVGSFPQKAASERLR